MKIPRPGKLAVRAVNQYRRRDVLTYLGLRYYLENSAARSDDWARRVATDLVHTRVTQPYFGALHFKDVSGSGRIDHRKVFLPSTNEALAEAALFDECARHPEGFSNPPCVFSYELVKEENDVAGLFKHYLVGLRERHIAVGMACDDFPNGIVRYTDVKRFYPSIHSDLALKAWRDQSEKGKLAAPYRELGERLIHDHAGVEDAGKNGILTGPMLSHLLGNLVFRKLDERFSKDLPARYFRYVDDITLVGNSDAVRRSLGIIENRLGELGLHLHDENSSKSIELSTVDWLHGRDDFVDSRQPVSWKTLIGDLKRFLLVNPERREIVQEAFRHADIRIPVLDYRATVYERGYLEKIRKLSIHRWFRRKSGMVSIESLLEHASQLSRIYEDEFRRLVECTHRLRGFERRRNIPKLRYRAGRLTYLAKTEHLQSLAKDAISIPELHFHAKVMAAVASAKIDEVLSLGTNAAQAAAQPLRASSRAAVLTREDLSHAEQQALAIFLLNGVSVVGAPAAQLVGSELFRFAATGADLELMRSANPFLRELACLHGLSAEPRHASLLEAVFDENEELALDAVDQLQQSASP